MGYSLVTILIFILVQEFDSFIISADYGSCESFNCQSFNDNENALILTCGLHFGGYRVNFSHDFLYSYDEIYADMVGGGLLFLVYFVFFADYQGFYGYGKAAKLSPGWTNNFFCR